MTTWRRLRRFCRRRPDGRCACRSCGPAHVGEVRAAADASGKIVAYEYHGWQHGWSGTEASAQLAGAPIGEFIAAAAMGVQGVNRLTCGGQYTIPNLRLVNHKLAVTDYLKAGWL